MYLFPRAADGTITTQFIMTTLEELGLLKMDFLGLRTLTVIQNAVQLARKKQPDLQIDKIDYNDKAVLDYIGTGKTEGIFQLESGGMKNFMKELQPHSPEDVIAGISLYRPGGWTSFHSISGERTTDHPSHMTAHSLNQSLHRLMAVSFIRNRLCRSCVILQVIHLDEVIFCVVPCPRKKQRSWKRNRKTFVYGDEETGVPGCIKNGIDEQTANKIYDEMIDFAKYALISLMRLLMQ